MTTTLLTIAVAATPFLVIAGLLALVDRTRARRARRYARQIALTDAIHRELGAVTAPTLAWRPGRGWLVHMTVPLDRPAVVTALLAITDRVLGGGAAAGDFRVVLSPRTTTRARAGRTPRRPAVGSAGPAVPALR